MIRPYGAIMTLLFIAACIAVVYLTIEINRLENSTDEQARARIKDYAGRLKSNDYKTLLTPLVNQLGRILEQYAVPEKKFPKDDYHKTKFECLDESQSELLASWLTEIQIGERNPEDLIKLCFQILQSNDFEQSIKKFYELPH